MNQALPPRRWRWWASPSLHLALFALALSLCKLAALEVGSRQYLECHWCLANKAVSYELAFLFLVGLLHVLSGLPRQRLLRFALRLLLVTLLLITVVDLVVLTQFVRRLRMVELIVFGAQLGAVGSFAKQLFSNWQGALLASAQGAAVALVLGRYLLRDRTSPRRAWVVGLVALGMTACKVAEPHEFHTGYLQNSVEAFFTPWTSNKPYSDAFKASLPPAPATKAVCTNGLGERPNIVLVLVESLSMYHSRLFSGMEDWTPQLDAASTQGRRLANFYANGITSEQALIALLTGEPPIARGTRGVVTEFEQFHQPLHSVPRLLGGLGYRTQFLTTGDLGFLDKGAWLKGIGFDTVEGSEAAAYNGMKRYQFGAAPDDALYHRALDQLAQDDGRPQFMLLETVTTHGPFVDPDTGQHSQERAFGYADRALGQFLGELRARGFFEHNGYVLVMGDHRAMLPMRAEETARYGDGAYARTPFVLLGSQRRAAPSAQPELTAFSQSDLYPSLQHWLGQGRQCFGPDEGVFLPTAVHAPACIYSHRPYDFNNVYAHCGGNDYVVKLNGDATAYAGVASGPPQLLNELHRLRLGQGFD
jgi:phosphoglycerol transferase MdoB-like AlkP superfamily enzyme